MYTRASTVAKREQVLATFSEVGEDTAPLRLIIATTAFGMGVDCHSIRRILHWGCPSSLEEYVQETGRCGRDGLDADAILFQGKESKHADEDIRDYRANNELSS